MTMSDLIRSTGLCAFPFEHAAKDGLKLPQLAGPFGPV